jgi:hypothetical protein
MNLDRECRMIVYSGASEFTLMCRPTQRLGRRLLAVLSDAAPIGAMVRIDCGESLVFGEVWACWSNGGSVHAVLQLSEVLTGHAELAVRSGLA